MDQYLEDRHDMQQTAPLIEALAIGATAAIAGHAVGGTVANVMQEGAQKFGRHVGITAAFDSWGEQFKTWKSQWTPVQESQKPSHTAVNKPRQSVNQQSHHNNLRRGTSRERRETQR